MENRPKMPRKYRSARPLVHGGSKRLTAVNLRLARKRWGVLKPQSIQNLKTHSQEFGFSIIAGDLILLDNGWYVTHTGLIRLARRKRCAGIDVKPVAEFSSTTACRWAFRATVFKSAKCHGFVGYGDADPSNVSSLVRGAEMRVAETRAVNRALRKAYGIGICSVEEIGSYSPSIEPAPRKQNASHPVGVNASGNGQPRLRDRLCLLIRQHHLNPTLVKRNAADYCGTAVLRDTPRD